MALILSASLYFALIKAIWHLNWLHNSAALFLGDLTSCNWRHTSVRLFKEEKYDVAFSTTQAVQCFCHLGRHCNWINAPILNQFEAESFAFYNPKHILIASKRFAILVHDILQHRYVSNTVLTVNTHFSEHLSKTLINTTFKQCPCPRTYAFEWGLGEKLAQKCGEIWKVPLITYLI